MINKPRFSFSCIENDPVCQCNQKIKQGGIFAKEWQDFYQLWLIVLWLLQKFNNNNNNK
jgi:hypothetical protein